MRVLITGAAGQDGTILSTMSARQGADVMALVKPGTDTARLREYVPSIEVIEADLCDSDTVYACVTETRPTHIYNLGGFTSPAESWAAQDEVFATNVDSVRAILAAILAGNRECRLFQASSSHIFEGTDRSPQVEDFELTPASPYAVSKAEALRLVREARYEQELFAVSGILYNHESPLRGENFVTRKVSRGVARIAAGVQTHLELGDLDVARDWGWAPDYVRGMILMMGAKEPSDYVLATGISHRLAFFVQRAFAAAGIRDWKPLVKLSHSDRPVDTNKMVGDSRNADTKLGWRHTVDFDAMAVAMVEFDRLLLADPAARWTDF
jgi:GDPmannose 4,6-dehydratase